MMLCEHCGKNEATIHSSIQVNGQKSESHLCSECAALLQKNKQGVYAGMFGQDMFHAMGFDTSWSNWLSDFFAPQPTERKIVREETPCPQCGMTAKAFRKTGRFGCDHCYSHFDAYLPNMLQQLHGKAEHVGSTPESASRESTEEEKLKQALAEAIAKEAFEEAATLRDAIKALQEKDTPSHEDSK